MHLVPEQFDLDQEKIFWALTFFKSGHTAKWSRDLFYVEVNTNIFPILSWSGVKT